MIPFSTYLKWSKSNSNHAHSPFNDYVENYCMRDNSLSKFVRSNKFHNNDGREGLYGPHRMNPNLSEVLQYSLPHHIKM